jgi:hypothetical protein
VGILVAIVLLLAIGASAFYLSRPKTEQPQTQNPTTQQQPSLVAPSSPSATPSEKTVAIPVAVFFSKHPQSDNDPAAVFPVDRMAPDVGVATYVIQQLLLGPNTKEASDGYFSTVRVRNDVSNCDNKDFMLSITKMVATLRFCRTFDAVGVMSDGQAQQTINASLLQFPTIQTVIILNKDGNCQFDMSGENRCLI